MPLRKKSEGLRSIPVRREQFYLWKVCSITGGVTCEESEVFNRGVRSDVEVRERGHSGVATPAIRKEAFACQKAGLPGERTPLIDAGRPGRTESISAFRHG